MATMMFSRWMPEITKREILSFDKSPPQASEIPLAFPATLLFILFLFVQDNPLARADKHLRLKQDHTPICVEGQFTKKSSERYYTVRARAGQHMRVEVVPITANLNTEGSVKFPNSDLEPG